MQSCLRMRVAWVEGLITGCVKVQVAEYCSCGRETRKNIRAAHIKKVLTKEILAAWLNKSLETLQEWGTWSSKKASKVLPAPGTMEQVLWSCSEIKRFCFRKIMVPGSITCPSARQQWCQGIGHCQLRMWQRSDGSPQYCSGKETGISFTSCS